MSRPFSERLAVLLQYAMPKQTLTALAGWVASRAWGPVTTALIARFVRRYRVDMAQAQQPDVDTYATFNEFFTRALKPELRPIAQAAYVCPVDGAISQLGAIEGHAIFQAKGHSYTTQALLGGDADLAAPYAGGQFATIYLSPRDYHRIHMPCAGRLTRMIHVPGDLFSVNPATARGVPGLFARNERVVCLFEGDAGPFAMVLVGATIVGSMATVWHGVVNPPRSGHLRQWHYTPGQVTLDKGAEMGRFLLGSTVVMLFPAGVMAFETDWSADMPVCMGQTMGHALGHAAPQ